MSVRLSVCFTMSVCVCRCSESVDCVGCDVCLSQHPTHVCQITLMYWHALVYVDRAVIMTDVCVVFACGRGFDCVGVAWRVWAGL